MIKGQIKISHYELMNEKPKDLMKKHSMSSSQLEVEVKKHLDGANKQEQRQFYKQVYKKCR